MERETQAKKKMDSLCNVFNGPGGGKMMWEHAKMITVGSSGFMLGALDLRIPL